MIETTIKKQTVYVHMDDSGVLHLNENYCIYGGVVFLSKEEQDIFIRKYKYIINQIKCHYCKNKKDKCSRRCPEIKDTNIYPNHKRWLFNLIKKQFNYAVIINNKEINKNIMKSKLSRGRFRDYSQKRIIKEILSKMIEKELIDPHQEVELVIRIDQQGTSTDTNRIFVNDIYQELIDGTFNYNYNLIFPPILFRKLKLDLKYVLSHRHVCVQASDIIAGETRKTVIGSTNKKEIRSKLSFINIILFLP